MALTELAEFRFSRPSAPLEALLGARFESDTEFLFGHTFTEFFTDRHRVELTVRDLHAWIRAIIRGAANVPAETDWIWLPYTPLVGGVLIDNRARVTSLSGTVAFTVTVRGLLGPMRDGVVEFQARRLSTETGGEFWLPESDPAPTLEPAPTATEGTRLLAGRAVLVEVGSPKRALYSGGQGDPVAPVTLWAEVAQLVGDFAAIAVDPDTVNPNPVRRAALVVNDHPALGTSDAVVLFGRGASGEPQPWNMVTVTRAGRGRVEVQLEADLLVAGT